MAEGAGANTFAKPYERNVRGSTDMDDIYIPTIKVTVKADCGIWILSFDCPWCRPKRGKKVRHSHGGGPTDRPPSYGYRASHCPTMSAATHYLLEPALNYVFEPRKECPDGLDIPTV